jgi:Insertion element 4 transposase N-terminal
LPKSVICVPGFGLSRPAGSSGSLREAVLAGPGAQVQVASGGDPISAVITPEAVTAALTAAGHTDKQRATLSGAVTTVLVLGLCLFCGQGSAGVITRLWPLLSVFNPVVVLCAPVCAVALSQARARLPVAVLRELFTQAAAAGERVSVTGSLMFGFLVTAVDGTVFDLAATDAIQARFATPSGGRFPQVRVVTLVECGTRRVLAAQVDSCQVSEQVLWDRLVADLKPGTINLADRNFFSMHRWQVAAATGEPVRTSV